MSEWLGKWKGGRYYRNNRSTGRLVYVIERKHRGRPYSIPLDAGNESQAEAQLALFFEDPVAFHSKRQTERTLLPEAVRIDETTTQAVLDALKRNGSEQPYLKEVRRYLVDWGNVLKGRPISTVSTRELKAHLKKWKGAQHHRKAAIKTFCTFFVDEGDLLPTENPAATLRMSEGKKQKRTKVTKKLPYSIAEVEAHYAALDTQAARDLFVLRCKAGMHGTEVCRVASGDWRIEEVDGNGTVICAKLTFLQKSGEHCVSLDAQMLAAARRLIAAKYAPGKGTMAKAVRRAAARLAEKSGDGAVVAHLHPGRLRHSFMTWARTCGKWVTVTGTGVAVGEIQQVVGHRSGSTVTTDHYIGGIPPLIWVPINLVHPDDPPPPAKSNPEPSNVHRLPVGAAG